MDKAKQTRRRAMRARRERMVAAYMRVARADDGEKYGPGAQRRAAQAFVERFGTRPVVMLDAPFVSPGTETSRQHDDAASEGQP